MSIDFITTDTQEITSEILGTLETELDEPLYPGDERLNFAQALCFIITLCYNKMNINAKQRFLRYASGLKLDAIGEEANCARLVGNKAQCVARFHLGAPLSFNVVVPQGTKVTGDGVKFFVTKELITINAGELYGDVEIEAIEKGLEYNGFTPGLINSLVNQIPYIARCENLTITAGGDDGEPYPEVDGGIGDANYLQRIQLALAASSTAGSELSYIYHTRSVSSLIKDVKITSDKAAGTVEVTFMCEGGVKPDDALIDKVRDKLNSHEIVPDTDLVIVQGVEHEDYEIEIKYYTTQQEENEVVQEIESQNGAIQRYIKWQGSKIGQPINPDRLRAEILKSDIKKTGAQRVEIIKPQYKEIGNYNVAHFSGALIVTHEITEDRV